MDVFQSLGLHGIGSLWRRPAHPQSKRDQIVLRSRLEGTGWDYPPTDSITII